MTTRLNPYLAFRDTTREAMEFYQSVFGGELTMNTFAEFEAADDASEQDKIMHAMLTTEDGLVLMGSDTPKRLEYRPGTNYSVSLSGDDGEVLRGYWDRLSAGGTVIMPLEPSPWMDSFGMCIDKFGVNWMVNISGTPA